MPRPNTILQSDFPYHVTARSINKEWFKIPMPEVWNIFSDHLYFISKAFDAKIHAFVLMNNHFHLIISTPNENLSEIMAYFMRSTTWSLNLKAGRINQAYGRRHFKTVLNSDNYYQNTYKYIYRNPVDAGLSKTCETYRYSSLSGLLGLYHLPFPVVEDKDLFDTPAATILWLNTTPVTKDLFAVKSALRHQKFQLASAYKYLETRRI